MRILATRAISNERRNPIAKVARIALRLTLGATVAFVSFHCSGQTPLSIKMHHPETMQNLTCSARDQTARADATVLAAAVESCAKTLEARGFVRE